MATLPWRKWVLARSWCISFLPHMASHLPIGPDTLHLQTLQASGPNEWRQNLPNLLSLGSGTHMHVSSGTFSRPSRWQGSSQILGSEEINYAAAWEGRLGPMVKNTYPREGYTATKQSTSAIKNTFFSSLWNQNKFLNSRVIWIIK